MRQTPAFYIEPKEKKEEVSSYLKGQEEPKGEETSTKGVETEQDIDKTLSESTSQDFPSFQVDFTAHVNPESGTGGDQTGRA